MICQNCGHHNTEIRKQKNPISEGLKMCSKCHENKPIDQYDRHSKNTPRLRPECKDCRKLINALRYKERKAVTKDTAN